ncbi:predicted protein [Chaetomium globosum CBS 148.51]|uniref:Uncharacterized protein n=1 Tax=Chaetomium globosum (strain ATCC 6205 / CBS 148.51 / DSM 1962 / NBRC 6347 / NRRL 1970) TaxID=306901 RepID=Q2GS37_CHAGB|nr:uncharacterized protein CHGG_09217 [Chaetomium globosum CBS 148.51]EAQ85203.1 predicted protein [Chaetomium globosum CBS 148.51]
MTLPQPPTSDQKPPLPRRQISMPRSPEPAHPPRDLSQGALGFSWMGARGITRYAEESTGGSEWWARP